MELNEWAMTTISKPKTLQEMPGINHIAEIYWVGNKEC